MKKYETPLLDELEKGPFPSFVTEIKRAAEKNPMANDELGLLERSFKDRISYWKHGGIVGVRGYGGGVIGRYCELAEEFPNVAHFHTVRINSIAGYFYTSETIRFLCDLCDRYGSRLTNFHGSTGALVFLGTTTDNLEPLATVLSINGFDLGGSGSALRTLSCCVGQARCEWSMIDTLNITYELTQEFQDELHRPQFPYKYKIKTVGCAIDCNAAIARADTSIIGTWKGPIEIDQDRVRDYAKKGVNIQQEIINMCPGKCMSWDGNELKIDDDYCVHCMHCIAKLSGALKPTPPFGATILIGAKAPFVIGAILSWVVVPFMEMKPPYQELKDLHRKWFEWWSEYGKNRERIGELILRRGMREFLEISELAPTPEMVKEPRRDPFWFWKEGDLEGKPWEAWLK